MKLTGVDNRARLDPSGGDGRRMNTMTDGTDGDALSSLHLNCRASHPTVALNTCTVLCNTMNASKLCKDSQVGARPTITLAQSHLVPTLHMCLVESGSATPNRTSKRADQMKPSLEVGASHDLSAHRLAEPRHTCAPNPTSQLTKCPRLISILQISRTTLICYKNQQNA